MAQEGYEETAHVTRAKSAISAYVAAITKQDSVQWKAYCDYVDFLEAERIVRHLPFTPEQTSIRYPELRLGLIDERIRQRTNELTAYKREYDQVAHLVEQLNIALHESPNLGSTLENPNEMLVSTLAFITETKDRAIEAFQSA